MNADEKEGLWRVNNRRGEACLTRHHGPCLKHAGQAMILSRRHRGRIKAA